MLAVSEAAALPPDLAGHLSECAACHSWWQLLGRVDAALVQLPAYPTDGKAKRQLLAQFRTATPKARPASKSDAPSARKKLATIVPAARKWPLGERLARLWPAGLVAAALLIGAIAWAVLGGKSNDQTLAAAPPDPLLEKAVASKAKLDFATTPAEKVVVLDDLAKDIHEQAHVLAKVSPGDMKSLAKMYEEVVTDALVMQARAVSPEDRPKVLASCRDHLRDTEAQVGELLKGGAPQASVGPLRDIERVARESGNKIAQLIQQGRAS